MTNLQHVNHAKEMGELDDRKQKLVSESWQRMSHDGHLSLAKV
jgi:hypothetical protein